MAATFFTTTAIFPVFSRTLLSTQTTGASIVRTLVVVLALALALVRVQVRVVSAGPTPNFSTLHVSVFDHVFDLPMKGLQFAPVSLVS